MYNQNSSALLKACCLITKPLGAPEICYKRRHLMQIRCCRHKSNLESLSQYTRVYQDESPAYGRREHLERSGGVFLNIYIFFTLILFWSRSSIYKLVIIHVVVNMVTDKRISWCSFNMSQKAHQNGKFLNDHSNLSSSEMKSNVRATATHISKLVAL